MQRLLPPLFAVVVALHVIAQPVVAAASAGWRQDTTCCCPDESKCGCPHGDHGAGMLRRCGDTGLHFAPALVKLVVPAAQAGPIAATACAIDAPARTDEDPEDRWLEPETPPF